MILSRSKPAVGDSGRKLASRNNVGKLEEYLARRDYTGALTLLEFQEAEVTGDRDAWSAYCAFHLGDYARAAAIFEKKLREAEAGSSGSGTGDDNALNLACCYFFLGMYPEASRLLEKAPDSPPKARLLFHLAHKIQDERLPAENDRAPGDTVEDLMCLASVRYLRAHYQEAIDVYKKVLLDNRDYLALNVYVALCYYKLDYYDVAQEVLRVYLQKYPDSAVAINLKACNHFRLYDGNAAQAEMKQLLEKTVTRCTFGRDLIRHNIVVFSGGEGALQVLPNLVDVIPEARLNLVIYHLKRNEIHQAYELMKDLEPSVPHEYILKGIVNAVMGQETGSVSSLKTAQHYFQLVGSSASECDTIPGRQCMASFAFLCRQFDQVLLYLNSIKTYFPNDDGFNFNYAQAQAAAGHFKEAEEALTLIRDPRYKSDSVYTNLLAYCYVINKKVQLAWELYLKMETSTGSFNLLQLVANTSYKMGQFWYAAKAFDMLEKMDPATPDYWEGKRGACCGTFQHIIADKQPKELLKEVIQLLRNTSNSQVDQIIRVMKKWAKDNRVAC